jgi:hypothetical protein
MTEREKKTEIIAVRVTAEIKKQLEKRAKEGFRSVSQEVEMILTKALEKDKSR